MKYTKLMLVVLLTGAMGQVEARGGWKSFGASFGGSYLGSSLANATSGSRSHSDSCCSDLRECDRENSRLRKMINRARSRHQRKSWWSEIADDLYL